MSIKTRLQKLERKFHTGDGPCTNSGYTIVLMNDQPIPADAAKCPRCGWVHVVRIIEEIVESNNASTSFVSP